MLAIVFCQEKDGTDMINKIERRTCNQCGNVVESEGGQIGGSAFSGWLTIERTDGSSKIPRVDNGPWHLCRNSCAIAFLKRKEQ